MNHEANHEAYVEALFKKGDKILPTLTPEKIDLWHAMTGVVSEAGEALDEVKKYMAYSGRELNRDHLLEELGDIEFYLAAARQAIGATREEVLAANRAKLDARYSAGRFSDAEAIARNDKAAA